MRTWMSTVENPKSVQFFEDSTDARLIRGEKYVLYRDYRVGRLGWWIDEPPPPVKGSKRTPRKILEPVTTVIAPGGEFLLYSPAVYELHRVSLPDGKEMRLPYRIPLSFQYDYVISGDGKTATGIEGVSNSKLVLVENPFVWK
jgi:hypothetical protein